MGAAGRTRPGQGRDLRPDCPPGRRTFELAGRWQGDHHDGVPIFVLGPGHIELELARRLEGPDVMHLRYRVRHCRAYQSGDPDGDVDNV